jgi:hypothetical protein
MRLPSISAERPIPQMQNTPSARAPRYLLSLAAALAVCSLSAEAQLPATSPTTLTGPLSATSNGATAPNKPHRADVTFNGGLLTVRANNSSLHQILSSISRQTGMKITGGVAEDRVFGSYGPAPAGTILATLLDGTGVNMLIQEGDAQQPIALVLTPRGGGPTPPSISAQDEQIGMDDNVPPPAPMQQPGQPQQSGQPQQQSGQQQYRQQQPQDQLVAPNGVPVQAQPANNVLGNPNAVTPTASQIPTTNSVPIDSLPQPSTTTQTQQGIVDTPNQAPPTSSAPSTPDQIYQQLLQLQQARAVAAANGSGTPPPPAAPPQ